jgi:hypothetical protein
MPSWQRSSVSLYNDHIPEHLLGTRFVYECYVCAHHQTCDAADTRQVDPLYGPVCERCGGRMVLHSRAETLDVVTSCV